MEQCWGWTQYDGGTPVSPETRFDLASLTKPLVTTMLCMLAVSQGSLRLETPIGHFVPRRLVPVSKAGITIWHVLSHSSGLPAYEPYYRKLILLPASRRRETLLSWILNAPLLDRPGRQCRYSDLGFILLGLLLEELFLSPLDSLAWRDIFHPLQMHELSFRRLQTAEDPTSRPVFVNPAENMVFAPTEDCPWRQRLLAGEVHDENGYCLEGVAGHAGLFGTARSIFRLLSHLFDVYRGAESEVNITRDVIQMFWTKPDVTPEGTWALGYDTPSLTGSSAGNRFSRHSVGHLGFTGTSLWIDLDREIIMILLTNRVHPSRENDRIKSFRPIAHDLVMECLNDN